VRILYLCHRIPYPPNKGDKIRAFHQVKALAERHEVDVFTLADDAADLENRHALARYCREVAVSYLNPRLARARTLPYLLTGTPLTVPYFYSAELQAVVRRALAHRSYDRIFVYCSAMAQYVEGQTIPILLDLVDVDSDKWEQYATFSGFPFSVIYRREARCLRAYERRICEASTRVLVTTDREARLVREIAPGAQVRVIPNGVNGDYFKPAAEPGHPPGIVFTGDMSYYPNEAAVVYFAEAVLPLVRREWPEARFYVVGRNPNPKVQRLNGRDGVEVTGFVPDVRAYLAKAQVAVAPFTIAAGIQNKILEAMAFGLPVVATPKVIQGLSASVAAMVAAGSSARDLADAVVQLLRNPQLAAERGCEGRRRVLEAYRWETALQQLLDMVEMRSGRLEGELLLPARNLEL
jgi:sugar transferase (PEP-CTERM/EpsH1 system associated)